MTRGTIILIGPAYREMELLSARLERENFSVVTVSDTGKWRPMLRQTNPLAILCSTRCSKSLIEAVTRVASRQKRYTIPVILLAEADVPASLTAIKSVGEVYRLHVLPLAKAVKRLRLAIQLSQLTSQYGS